MQLALSSCGRPWAQDGKRYAVKRMKLSLPEPFDRSMVVLSAERPGGPPRRSAASARIGPQLASDSRSQRHLLALIGCLPPGGLLSSLRSLKVSVAMVALSAARRSHDLEVVSSSPKAAIEEGQGAPRSGATDIVPRCP